MDAEMLGSDSDEICETLTILLNISPTTEERNALMVSTPASPRAGRRRRNVTRAACSAQAYTGDVSKLGGGERFMLNLLHVPPCELLSTRRVPPRRVCRWPAYRARGA